MLEGDVVHDKYRIQCEIGRGASAVVYRALQLNIQRPVAIKVLLPTIRTKEVMRHRLRREAKLASQLQSPHAVEIYDVGTTKDGALFVAMELVEGVPLDLVLREEKTLSPERTRRVIWQVLDTIGEAHSLGILHRDLKPSNIFLCKTATEKDFVKVIDFGVAKIIGSGKRGQIRETTRLTRQGEVLGTPVYMSPEQCRGQELTPASDLYSVGIIAFEMLQGHVPYDDPNPVQIILKHFSEPLPELPEQLAETTIAQAMFKALEKDPQDRFQTAEEFMLEIGVPDESGEFSLASIEDRAMRSAEQSWIEVHEQEAKSSSVRVYLLSILVVIGVFWLGAFFGFSWSWFY